MPFKDLLVVVDPGSDAAGRFAVSAARRFEAHLTAATLIVDPTTSLGYLETAAASLDSFLEEAEDCCAAQPG